MPSRPRGSPATAPPGRPGCGAAVARLRGRPPPSQGAGRWCAPRRGLGTPPGSAFPTGSPQLP
eukprot:8859887-Lingulodinium_polyedra.AAC.1